MKIVFQLKNKNKNINQRTNKNKTKQTKQEQKQKQKSKQGRVLHQYDLGILSGVIYTFLFGPAHFHHQGHSLYIKGAFNYFQHKILSLH